MILVFLNSCNVNSKRCATSNNYIEHLQSIRLDNNIEREIKLSFQTNWMEKAKQV